MEVAQESFGDAHGCACETLLSASWCDLMEIRNEIETFAMMTNTCPFLCDPLGNTVRTRFECTNDLRVPM